MKSSLKVSVEHVRAFLLARGWTLTRTTSRVQKYSPPSSLSIQGDYSISLPFNEQDESVSQILAPIVRTLGALYGITEEQLSGTLETAETVLSLQFQGDTTDEGSIPFNKLEKVLTNLRDALSDIASFVVKKLPVLDSDADEAATYLEKCDFLQTDVGSFILNVRLPTTHVLRASTLFPEDKLTSDTVTHRLEDVLQFVVGSVMRNDQNLFMPAALDAFANVNSVDVIKDVAELIENSGSEEILFKFISPERTVEVRTGQITEQVIGHLYEYIKYLGEQYSGELDLDVSGKIYEMSSGNPKADRNRIVLRIIFEGAVEKLAAVVNTFDYHNALDAHGKGYAVRLVGVARRMKTQLYMEKPKSFEIIVPKQD